MSKTPKAPRTVLVPTAAGFLWLAAALALLATAINYGNNLVFALAFLLVSVLLISAWQCGRNLCGLEWLPAPPPAAFAGGMLELAGSVRNPARRRRDPVLLCSGRGHALRLGKPAALPRGTAGEIAALTLNCPAAARGLQRLNALRLISPHPLGLWLARRTLPEVTALVYPQPQGSASLPAHAPNPAHRQREAGDFRGLRTYAPGDAPRRVNWRVYARTNELMVNDFDGGKGGHALWLDIAACPGDTESRLSQLCQWVLEADRIGREYGLRLDDGPALPPGRGRAHRTACLRRLALYGIKNLEQEQEARIHE